MSDLRKLRAKLRGRCFIKGALSDSLPPVESQLYDASRSLLTLSTTTNTNVLLADFKSHEYLFHEYFRIVATLWFLLTANC